MVINSHVHLEKLHTVDKNKKVINSQYFKLNKSINPEIAIEFQDVSFNYMGSDSSIFKNLNIDILKNRHTIITGANGSGKSTFLGICAGVFYPESGTVNTYSNKYGYVGVTPLIFTDSLRNNLLYGNEYKIDDHNIIELIKKFQLFNESFDINLDKIVSNKSLSSGQMQKISFIRALLSKVDILILDESMSNLDSSTKELIYEILGKLELTIINSTHSTENLAYDVHFEIKMSNDIREVIIHN
jgi:ABC-type multidrug transport system fused ATPase/permease subunit